MLPDIKKQIESIDKSLRWLKMHRKDHFEQRFLQLTEERRKLKKIEKAKEEKPAIAAFGESQKGKSYLIGNLLQKKGAPFMVTDEAGNNINFVDRVNPIGDKREATGVVTRFSSGKGDEEKRCQCHGHTLEYVLSHRWLFLKGGHRDATRTRCPLHGPDGSQQWLRRYATVVFL